MNVGETRLGVNALFAGAVVANVVSLSEKYLVNWVIAPVNTGVFRNAIVCVAVTVLDISSPVSMVCPDVMVAVIIAVPPEVAVPFRVTFPRLDTVQKLLVGVEYVMYVADTLLVKNPAISYVPVFVTFLVDVAVFALSVAVIVFRNVIVCVAVTV